jgi:membrane protease YdiL (CAAX protease family)
LIVIFGLVWPGLGIPRLAGYSVAPERLDLVLSAMAFVVLFGAAVLVTAVVGGRPGIRRLLAGIVHWRIGVGRWLLVAGALPALTLAVAGATGTLHSPPEGWLRMGVTYLVTGLVGGALLTHVWEEAAWAGFVQQRLMKRHGLLVGSLLTAVPFALIHVPGVFHTPATSRPTCSWSAIWAPASSAPAWRSSARSPSPRSWSGAAPPAPLWWGSR